MNQGTRGRAKAPGSVFGASELMDRLLKVRKRKRAFGGQTVDMEAVRRRLAEERRRRRGR